MLNVYIYKLENKIDLLNLPKVVVNHINKYKNKQAKKISSFAWSKACDILSDNDFNFKCLSFDKNQQPIIKKSKLFFNISHSDKYIAIAISDSPVGIDIQKNVNIKQANFMAKKLFTKKQYDKYLKSKNKSVLFTLTFSQIEAIYKMNHFIHKLKKQNKNVPNSFNLLIEKRPYSLSIINETGDKISPSELEYGGLKVQLNNL